MCFILVFDILAIAPGFPKVPTCSTKMFGGRIGVAKTWQSKFERKLSLLQASVRMFRWTY